jgi:hypothetical protein
MGGDESVASIFPENMLVGNNLKLDLTLQFERYNTSADVLHEY